MSTISINRISVVCATILWFFIVQGDGADGAGTLPAPSYVAVSPMLWKGVIFAFIIAMGILEGLSAQGNMLSMERDWVVTAASPEGRPYDLTQLNSSMRRIDLICKLVAPIAISVLISTTSVQIGVLIVGTMSTLSWAAEYLCARRVWQRNPRLKAAKVVPPPGAQESASTPANASFFSLSSRNLQTYARDFQMYFSSPVWIPSISLALLHISALAYNATFITYLLTVGFSLDVITIARAAGSVVEISSTVVTPVGIRYLGNPKTHGRYNNNNNNNTEEQGEEAAEALLETPRIEEEIKTEMGLERLGLWGLSFQLINLVRLLHMLTLTIFGILLIFL
jgi:iron-regulated transporter 1